MSIEKLVPDISRREAIGRFALYGTAMAILRGQASGQSADAASYSNSAIALPQEAGGDWKNDPQTAVKIARAMRSGPSIITREPTVAEMDQHGNRSVLRQGNNGWTCFPGNENVVGDPPMCADELALQWFKDVHTGKPAPTIKAPGLCYMLCGATQHSNDTPFDRTSPAIPIGPHWMILWPFDAKHCGLPTTVRDGGAWIMFSDTPYAYLHVCGNPWDGKEYEMGDDARWTMQYVKSH